MNGSFASIICLAGACILSLASALPVYEDDIQTYQNPENNNQLYKNIRARRSPQHIQIPKPTYKPDFGNLNVYGGHGNGNGFVKAEYEKRIAGHRNGPQLYGNVQYERQWDRFGPPRQDYGVGLKAVIPFGGPRRH